MQDVVYIIVMVVTMALMIGLALMCQRVIRPAELENREHSVEQDRAAED